MARSHRRHDPGIQIIFGLTIIVAGILFLLDNLRILRAGDYLRYWPAALVAIGVAQISQARTPSRIWTGAIWITVGTALIADRIGIFRVNLWSLWPLILVAIGGRIFWQAFNRESQVIGPDPVGPLDGPAVGPPDGSPPVAWPTSGSDAPQKPFVERTEPRPFSTSDGSTISATALMGSFKRKVTSKAFRRAELTAVMGGGTLDLTDAAIADSGAVIDVFAFMGGFEIRVPESWDVEVEVTPFMGNCDDKTMQHAAGTAPRVTIRGFVMMGGVDIKNGPGIKTT